MKKTKAEIEKRIQELEGSVIKYQEAARSAYATNYEVKHFLTVLIPGIKIRIDELKWVLGTI